MTVLAATYGAAKLFATIGVLTLLAAFFTETVNLAIVAGTFSVINTILNAVVIKNVKHTKETANEVRQIVDRRKQPREENV